MSAKDIQEQITAVDAPRVVANHRDKTAYVVGRKADEFPNNVSGFDIIDDPSLTEASSTG